MFFAGTDRAQSDDNRPIQHSSKPVSVQVKLGKGRRIKEKRGFRMAGHKTNTSDSGGAFIRAAMGSSLLHGQLARARLHPPNTQGLELIMTAPVVPSLSLSPRRQPAHTHTHTHNQAAGPPARRGTKNRGAGCRCRHVHGGGREAQDCSQVRIPSVGALTLASGPVPCPKVLLALLPALSPRHPGQPGHANAG